MILGSKMGKTLLKKDPLTPRRRNSLTKTGGVGKIAKILSRPASSSVKTICVGQTANVRVVVRVRPPTETEQGSNYRNVIKVINDQMLIFDPKDDEQPFFFHGVQQKSRDLLKKSHKDINFIFDKVFSDASCNEEVFTNSTKNLVDTLMKGYNCSVFAYGATGAGKTFTMIGNEKSPGITYLTMKDLFKQKDELSGEREFELMVTYIEVYNELVKDLLNPGQPLNLREDMKYGVVISGVKGHKITNPDELFALLEQGNKRRTQHPTDANSESSRSHAVFQVYIQMIMKSNREVRRAKLSMIDLAGSERGSATGFVGARFKEGANINKSLLALGNCINSLADGKSHVPYRDSKLTRLLKDSLGGNCHTIMIANISPSSLSFDDTYNTLKYATRAKSIKANIKKNIVNAELHVDQYIKLVDDLQSENKTLKTENANLKTENANLKTINADLQLKLENIRDQAMAASSDGGGGDSPNTEGDTDRDTATELKSPRNLPLTPTKLLSQKRSNGNGVPTARITPCQSTELTDAVSIQSLTIKNLIDKQKELLERKFQLENTTLGMALKRKLKVESNKRLSTIFVDSSDKNEAHRKLEEQIDRSVKKEQVTEEQTRVIERERNEIDRRIETLLEENIELSEQCKIYKNEVKLLEFEYENKLKQKEMTILLDDNNEKCNVIEKMARLMKSVFLAIGGTLDAPESVKKEYSKLIDYFQGKKNLSWLESELDTYIPITGLSTPESGIDTTNLNRTRIISKHKMDSNSESLDSTYSLTDKDKQPETSSSATNTDSVPTSTSELTVPSTNMPTISPSKLANHKRADGDGAHQNIVAKASKNLAPKRLACGLSPRSRPANFVPYHKRMNTAARLATTTSKTTINLRNIKGSKLSDRPRFRS